MTEEAGLPPLVVVVGPTASGKTELALELAERRRGEIIGADSVQVYRHFDVGTGKPTAAERARAAHHLVDLLDPMEPIDAARWAELASRAVAEVLERGREPIVCGGSFLWVRALLYGLAPAPPGDAALRERHRALADSEGRSALHAMLARVDPEGAGKLAPNDFVRVSRALEVFELTGTPLAHFHEGHGFRTPRYEVRLVGLRREPAELDRRIETRVHAMLAAGWIDEVRALCARGYEHARAMGSVGYRQILAAIKSGASLDEPALGDSIRRATRVFARRQRTWLRDENVEWLDEVAARRFS